MTRWQQATALIGGLQALDLLTTALALTNARAREGNPLTALLLTHGGWPALVGYKIITTALIGCFLMALARDRRDPVGARRWARALTTILTLVLTVTVANNAWILR